MGGLSEGQNRKRRRLFAKQRRSLMQHLPFFLSFCLSLAWSPCDFARLPSIGGDMGAFWAALPYRSLQSGYILLFRQAPPAVKALFCGRVVRVWWTAAGETKRHCIDHSRRGVLPVTKACAGRGLVAHTAFVRGSRQLPLFPSANST